MSAQGAGGWGYGIAVLALAAGGLAWSRRRHGRPARVAADERLRDHDSIAGVPRGHVRRAVEASKGAVAAASAAARR
jgi:hypothetical protein